MKKRILASVMALLFAFTLIPKMAVYANEISVTVNGEHVNFENQPPVNIDGRTLVPVRAVFEHLGFIVEWDIPTQTATITRGNDVIVITIGSAEFTTNEASHMFDVQAQIIGGSTMVPIRLPLESVGYNLDWDGDAGTVVITGGTPDATATSPTTHPTTNTLHRIREFFHPDDTWVSDNIERFSNELDMSVDEIFDYVRAASNFDYIFDYGPLGNMDVNQLAEKVGSSQTDFMNIVMPGYTVTRHLDLVNTWSAELSMTLDELMEIFIAEGAPVPFNELAELVSRGEMVFSPLSESLGIDWYQMQHVLINVSNAFTLRDSFIVRE